MNDQTNARVRPKLKASKTIKTIQKHLPIVSNIILSNLYSVRDKKNN